MAKITVVVPALSPYAAFSRVEENVLPSLNSAPAPDHRKFVGRSESAILDR
ncbi:hypothetical protein [Rhodoferax sp. GW822-FHT02A01]|uniref:hypothetical protein n=1 Tax=Rhodoferax sp. GW822-FHT02A01 TaxID=3141537 RepID=UPI00315D818B